jgi:hypothetical protein
MGASRNPLQKILEIPEVRASYVFGPGGEVVARGEGAALGSPTPVGQLGALARSLDGDRSGVSEAILFYPTALFLLRCVGQYVLVVAADARAVPSLLRVTVEVLEHEWRARGLERIFPRVKEGAPGAAGWRKLFGRH